MLLVETSLIKKMDRRQKCKKCRKGVVGPTFNGNEFRCFVCGYVTDLSLS
jgi:hypothetical protein